MSDELANRLEKRLGDKGFCTVDASDIEEIRAAFHAQQGPTDPLEALVVRNAAHGLTGEDPVITTQVCRSEGHRYYVGFPMSEDGADRCICNRRRDEHNIRGGIYVADGCSRFKDRRFASGSFARRKADRALERREPDGWANVDVRKFLDKGIIHISHERAGSATVPIFLGTPPTADGIVWCRCGDEIKDPRCPVCELTDRPPTAEPVAALKKSSS